jgi:hypothetical protein
LQFGSNDDVHRGDGIVTNKNFSLEFELFLVEENITGKPEDTIFTVDYIDYKIDTSYCYE